jgi:OOP family OmpA-OmpF porin
MLEDARELAKEVESCEPPPEPAPPPAPEPAPEPEPVEEPEPEKPAVLQTVYFAFDSSVLWPGSETLLDDNAAVLLDNPGLTVEVAGHTCSMGKEKYNRGLSERRSKKVIEYLVSRGIARDRMILRGYGETRPAQPNDTAEGRRLNRRVEFIIQ